MAFHKSALFLLSLALLSLFHVPISAAKKSYIVYLGVHNHGLVNPDQITSTHHDLLGSVLSREKAKEYSIFHSYTSNFNGFAARLEEDEAVSIAQHPSVVSMFLDKSANLQTSHSWETMDLEKNGVALPQSLWRKANYGEDVIIANLDTGVWPESESFSDEGFGPVPSQWKGGCQNNTKEGVLCNNKLIGAKFYKTSYEQAGNSLTNGNNSAHDHEGHGTHTLSTAGCNFVNGVNYFGVDIGTIKGGSPKARVAAYKVCFPKTENSGGCYYGDGLQAFIDATDDGVDVISFSVGGTPDDYVYDGFALGAFEAVKQGIVVVCSAGNEGPDPGTVTNVAPWILTVAASTIDNREYANKVVLKNGKHIKGASLAKNDLPKGKFYPLINSEKAKAVNATAEDAMICLAGSLDPAKVTGKIIACLRGKNGRLQKGIAAKSAGAVGMILCNDKSTGNNVASDHHAIPATHINYKDGQAVYAYINSTIEPEAYITAPKRYLGVKPSPTMANFSSVGPNAITPGILKPDITAPGVNIIASYMNADDPIAQPLGKTPYEFMSGTSMACPHVPGVAGLLKVINRDWSPAAIKSAILTTASTTSNVMQPILSAASQKATPFNYGHGHIRPNSAANPGLVYDLTETDYLDFLCASGYNKTMMQSFTNMSYECPENFHIKDLNYPPITLTNVTSEGVTATQKVMNVGTPGTYTVKIQQPVGFSVSVEPSTLKFERIGEEKSFKVSFKALSDAGQDFVFGGMTWTDGTHYVRSPLVVSASA